jgi:hypothetical protein
MGSLDGRHSWLAGVLYLQGICRALLFIWEGVGKDPLKGAALLASISVFSEHG